jgi:hypothetical protein
MAEERRKRAQKGGRSGGRGRPQAELHRLQKWFEELAQQVIKGEVDRSDAAVTGQLLNYARACKSWRMPRRGASRARISA